MSKKELISLTVTAIVIKMLLSFSSSAVKNSGQAAWIEILYVSLIAAALIFVTGRIYRFKKDVITLAEMRGGKTLRIIVGTAVFLLLLSNFSSTARVFSESVKVILLQNERIEGIIAAFAAAAVIGAYMGINSISRVNFMFLPIAGAAFLALLFLLIPYYDLRNIMPVLGEGAAAVFGKGLSSLSLFSDVLLLNILIPYTKNMSEAKSGIGRGIIISAAVSMLVVLAYCLAYKYPASEDYLLPMYQLMKMIHISSFFSRFEAIFQFIWSILILLYSALYIFAMSIVLQKTFSLKYAKPLIIPISLIAVAAARMPESVSDTVRFSEFMGAVEVPVAFLLPIALGILTLKYDRRHK